MMVRLKADTTHRGHAVRRPHRGPPYVPAVSFWCGRYRPEARAAKGWALCRLRARADRRVVAPVDVLFVRAVDDGSVVQEISPASRDRMSRLRPSSAGLKAC